MTELKCPLTVVYEEYDEETDQTFRSSRICEEEVSLHWHSSIDLSEFLESPLTPSDYNIAVWEVKCLADHVLLTPDAEEGETEYALFDHHTLLAFLRVLNPGGL